MIEKEGKEYMYYKEIKRRGGGLGCVEVGIVMIKVRGRIKVERRRRLVRVRGCRSWLVIE